MATTKVDRHNERFTPEALESMKEHIESAYLPFIVDHDPRCPPLGRVVSAEITDLGDGERAIEGIVEIFESGDELPFDETRAVKYRALRPDAFVLTVDRAFEQEQFQVPLAAIAGLFGSTPTHEVKKALEPIAVLGIGLGAVAVGKFAGAFFAKLGSNAADALSTHLKNVFRRRRPEEVQLLRLEFEYAHLGRECRAELIVTGPTDSDIDGIFAGGIAQIDTLLPRYLAPNVTRYVFEYSSGKASIKFAVRSDAVPLFPKDQSET